jgi:ribA/ribD-fused uncharacterized protein
MIDKFEGKYRCYSNFSLDPVSYKGVMYRTSEHAFQCAKATTQLDHNWVMNQPTPGKAKKAGSRRGLGGQRIKIKPDWDAVKIDVMLEILRLKFQLPSLKTILLESRDDELVEGNTWHDNYWGDCFCNSCQSIVGQNHLGKLLMQVREEYMNEVDNNKISV